MPGESADALRRLAWFSLGSRAIAFPVCVSPVITHRPLMSTTRNTCADGEILQGPRNWPSRELPLLRPCVLHNWHHTTRRRRVPLMMPGTTSTITTTVVKGQRGAGQLLLQPRRSRGQGGYVPCCLCAHDQPFPCAVYITEKTSIHQSFPKILGPLYVDNNSKPCTSR